GIDDIECVMAGDHEAADPQLAARARSFRRRRRDGAGGELGACCRSGTDHERDQESTHQRASRSMWSVVLYSAMRLRFSACASTMLFLNASPYALFAAMLAGIGRPLSAKPARIVDNAST